MVDLYSKYPDLPSFSSHIVSGRKLRGIFTFQDGTEQSDILRGFAKKKIENDLEREVSDEWLENNWDRSKEDEAFLYKVFSNRAAKARKKLKEETGSDRFSDWAEYKTEKWVTKTRIEAENRNFIFRVGLPMSILREKHTDPNELNSESKKVSSIISFKPNGKILKQSPKQVFDEEMLTGDFVYDILHPRNFYRPEEYVKKTVRKWTDSKGVHHEKTFLPGDCRQTTLPDNSYLSGLDYLSMLIELNDVRAVTTSPCKIKGFEGDKLKTQTTGVSLIAVLDIDGLPIDEYRDILAKFDENNDIKPTYVLIHIKTKEKKTANLQIGWILERQEDREKVSEFTERLTERWNEVSPYPADECFTKYVYKNPLAFDLYDSFEEIPADFETNSDAFAVVFGGAFTKHEQFESLLSAPEEIKEHRPKVEQVSKPDSPAPLQEKKIQKKRKTLRTSAQVANEIRHLVNVLPYDEWIDLYEQKYLERKKDKTREEILYSADYFYKTAWTEYDDRDREISMAVRKRNAELFTMRVEEYLKEKSLSDRNWNKSRKETKERHFEGIRERLRLSCLPRKLSTIEKKVRELIYGRFNEGSLRSHSSLETPLNDGSKTSSSTPHSNHTQIPSSNKTIHDRLIPSSFLQNSILQLRESVNGLGNTYNSIPLFMNGSNSCSS